MAAGALPASAQDYPSKPIRIIAPFGPGTATDTVARVIGNELGKLTGQAVVIDNKPGADCQIGAQATAAAVPTASRVLHHATGRSARMPQTGVKFFTGS